LGDIVESEEENSISNNNSNHSSRYSYNTNDISTSDLINSSKNNNNNSINNSINDNSVEASYQFARLSLDQVSEFTGKRFEYYDSSFIEIICIIVTPLK